MKNKNQSISGQNNSYHHKRQPTFSPRSELSKPKDICLFISLRFLGSVVRSVNIASGFLSKLCIGLYKNYGESTTLSLSRKGWTRKAEGGEPGRVWLWRFRWQWKSWSRLRRPDSLPTSSIRFPPLPQCLDLRETRKYASCPQSQSGWEVNIRDRQEGLPFSIWRLQGVVFWSQAGCCWWQWRPL